MYVYVDIGIHFDIFGVINPVIDNIFCTKTYLYYEKYTLYVILELKMKSGRT